MAGRSGGLQAPRESLPAGTGPGTIPLAVSTDATARPTVTSFIRDTLYSTSAHTASSRTGVHAPITGSHSSKFAVLNALQQQNQHTIGTGTDALMPLPPGPRAQPRALGLDLTTLLAGVGGTHAGPQPLSCAEPPLMTAGSDRKGKVPRTLSGRPRPTAAGGVVAPPFHIQAPTTVVAEPEALPEDSDYPREDNTAAVLLLNSARAQSGTTPPTGNQTARRLSGANDSIRSLPVPPAIAGTMSVLGGTACGPEFRGMQPARVVALYAAQLTPFERREVIDYDDVYFIGPQATKTEAPVPNAPNFGYDDDRGDYVVVKLDHVAYRYEVLGELGCGSFGQVLKVKDYKRNCECALKIIRNRKRFHQQAQVEIRILEHLRSRDPEDKSCTVRMLNYFQFRSHTCITFELHAMNLYELTKLNRYQPFPPALIKRFTGQLLVAASFMWREQIVHCDLKPENILLKQENKTGIKVIDFGSSCFETERVYSYIQSRFYRAPEIVLGLPYGRPIDLWSVGCIICEMAIGFPVFPGENEHDQLLCMMEVLGLPPSRLIEKSPRKSKFFDANGQPRLVPNSRNKLRRPSTKDLQAVLRTDDLAFVDFILQFLKWDPAERVTPNEAMRHPYIAECFHQDTIPPGPATAGAQARSSISVPRPAMSGRSGSSAPGSFGEQQPSFITSQGRKQLGSSQEAVSHAPSSARVKQQSLGQHTDGSLTARGSAALPSISTQPAPSAKVMVSSSHRRARQQTTSNRLSLPGSDFAGL